MNEAAHGGGLLQTQKGRPGITPDGLSCDCWRSDSVVMVQGCEGLMSNSSSTAVGVTAAARLRRVYQNEGRGGC